MKMVYIEINKKNGLIYNLAQLEEITKYLSQRIGLLLLLCVKQ